MSQQATTEFGKLRSIFWPIHGHELKKVIPMFLMFFCISFNYTILRDTKDTLVVGSSGAETIAFLKFWGEFIHSRRWRMEKLYLEAVAQVVHLGLQEHFQGLAVCYTAERLQHRHSKVQG